MPTKTIGVREDVYERLVSEKREGESFSDTIDRLVESSQSDWRRSFGKLEDSGDELREIVEEQREDLSISEAERQQRTVDETS
ncbi:MAG: antitoxin VapB family protein [Halobacteria archaeon]|nr:antitoxin VapB family protein [Halobacteria archaeon]